VHPHEARDVTPQHLEQLTQLAKHRKVIAWGEVGLDYFYDHSPRDVQDRVFREQLGLAHQAKLPVIIHCRDAWSDTLKVLEQVWKPTGLGGILHCFTSTLEDAERGLDMGFLISFAGNSTYPKASNIRDVAKALPLENILIETDSPFLAPQGYRGKRNEPAYVGEVAKAIASVRNLATEEVASATAANFRRFFELEERP
jgi:TatD DNase family protein